MRVGRRTRRGWQRARREANNSAESPLSSGAVREDEGQMADLSIENGQRAIGFGMIAGVDEAGRGPLAGPVSAAAVILPDDFEHAELNDSKKLTETVRERLYGEIVSGEMGVLAWSSAMCP